MGGISLLGSVTWCGLVQTFQPLTCFRPPFLVNSIFHFPFSCHFFHHWFTVRFGPDKSSAIVEDRKSLLPRILLQLMSSSGTSFPHHLGRTVPAQSGFAIFQEPTALNMICWLIPCWVKNLCLELRVRSFFYLNRNPHVSLAALHHHIWPWLHHRWICNPEFIHLATSQSTIDVEDNIPYNTPSVSSYSYRVDLKAILERQLSPRLQILPESGPSNRLEHRIASCVCALTVYHESSPCV